MNFVSDSELQSYGNSIGLLPIRNIDSYADSLARKWLTMQLNVQWNLPWPTVLPNARAAQGPFTYHDWSIILDARIALGSTGTGDYLDLSA
jgi:hypothetical protein